MKNIMENKICRKWLFYNFNFLSTYQLKLIIPSDDKLWA